MNFSHQLFQLRHRPRIDTLGVEVAGYLVQIVGHIDKNSPLSSRLIAHICDLLSQAAQAAEIARRVAVSKRVVENGLLLGWRDTEGDVFRAVRPFLSFTGLVMNRCRRIIVSFHYLLFLQDDNCDIT